MVLNANQAEYDQLGLFNSAFYGYNNTARIPSFSDTPVVMAVATAPALDRFSRLKYENIFFMAFQAFQLWFTFDAVSGVIVSRGCQEIGGCRRISNCLRKFTRELAQAKLRRTGRKVDLRKVEDPSAWRRARVAILEKKRWNVGRGFWMNGLRAMLRNIGAEWQI
ncbi:hypothetical protein BC938DRAFT_476316 [Jimgerdemannia flammicorona]|uniref:Uncharacterized protein n=1 Tax=Jimgerdemannia flammicorona TaxID=994334 RepID=A0A433QQL8_9FUNG|nr:hypothetical protein BC938DRAFT_476316 [Jimgerdemannia flammicorona]